MGPQALDEAIRALAGVQQRNVTHQQLRSLGATQDAIKHRLRKSWLHRVYPGVYSVGTPPNTPLEWASAAVLAWGAGAALSHSWALALWGLAKRWEMPPHVMATTDRRSPKLVVHQSRTLTDADVRVHRGIRVTSPARTLLDCARTMAAKARTRAVNDALRSPYLTASQLADVCARNPSHPGIKLLRQFLDATTGLTRSEFEDAFLAFCLKYGLPNPLVNAIVHGYEADAVFPAERVIVELDGWQFHGDRAAFEHDRERDAALLAAGFVTVRITWRRLIECPELEAARLRTILARRASELAAGLGT